jgi:AraC family transcriptional regulator
VWLPASGMQIDSRPLFELYDAEASEDLVTGVFTCKICIPVRLL